MLSGIYFKRKTVTKNLSCNLFFLRCLESPEYTVLSYGGFLKHLTGLDPLNKFLGFVLELDNLCTDPF